AVLGYLDPWTGSLALGALLAMDGGAFGWGGALLTLAVLTKLQSVLVIPVAGLLLLHRAGRAWAKAVVAASAGALTTGAVLLMPFARIGALPNLRRGVGSLLWHDMLSGEAANTWWLVTWLLRASC